MFSGGLQVTTTLDPQMQRYAEEAVANRLPDARRSRGGGRRDRSPQRRRPRDVRGKNFAVSKVNLATGDGGSGRQAGSAFKPFTLATAMEQGYSLNSRWSGPASITIPDPACYTDGAPWQLSNAADEESGDFTLLQATAFSVNTVFAQVASAVTPEAIVETAHRHGDPVAARARVLDHARDAGGHAARDDERVRDARGSRVAAPCLAARAGRPRGRQDRPADRRPGQAGPARRTTPTS